MWRRYLKDSKDGVKDVKLIVAGFNLCTDPDCANHLNLTEVPQNINGFLANTKSVDEDWEISGDGVKEEIQEKLSSFFKGHGSYSLFQKLNYLQMAIINIQESIAGNLGRSYEDAITNMIPLSHKLWREFQNRWESYQVYFVCTPFCSSQNKIEQLLEEIKGFFELEKPSIEEFQKYPCLKHIKTIRKELKHMNKYVRD